jgi:hypothetical protein
MEILGSLNSEPPDYESGVPITETQHSVLSVVMRTKILLSFKFNQLVIVINCWSIFFHLTLALREEH